MNDLNDRWIDGIKNIMVELYNKSRETYFVNFFVTGMRPPPRDRAIDLRYSLA